MLRVFNEKTKNLEFDTPKIITNAWFSKKNYRLGINTQHWCATCSWLHCC